MCIICVSKRGIQQPTLTQLRTMFDSNPHGAGYMVARGSHVEIHKGFMYWEDFARQVQLENFTADDVIVYHFRISTQAGVNPQMTHPFPLTASLDMCEKLDINCPCGVAHNGIITLTTDHKNTRYSDTALFITQYMHKIVKHKSDLHDPCVLKMLDKLTNSNLAILDRTGDVAVVGNFIREKNGLLFSNYTYREANLFCKDFDLKKFSLA